MFPLLSALPGCALHINIHDSITTYICMYVYVLSVYNVHRFVLAHENTHATDMFVRDSYMCTH